MKNPLRRVFYWFSILRLARFCGQRLLPLGCRSCVGADECNEAAILYLTIESKAKDQDQDQDQKIAGFASSYRAQREQAPSPQ